MKELRRACTSFQVQRNLQHLSWEKLQTLVDSIEIKFLQLESDFTVSTLRELKMDVNKIIGYNEGVDYSLPSAKEYFNSNLEGDDEIIKNNHYPQRKINERFNAQ